METLCCFVFYSTRRFVLSLALCYFVLGVFSPISPAITSLGEERANLSVFGTFFDLRLFDFVSFLFLLVSGNGCPQFMVLAKIRKIMYTPVNRSFTVQRLGLWGQIVIGTFS